MFPLYLRMSADVGGISITDDLGRTQISLDDLEIADELRFELVQWADAYEHVAHWTNEERATKLEQIRCLDARGLELSKELRDSGPPGAKVRYFSEGLGREISSIEEFDYWAKILC